MYNEIEMAHPPQFRYRNPFPEGGSRSRRRRWEEAALVIALFIAVGTLYYYETMDPVPPRSQEDPLAMERDADRTSREPAHMREVDFLISLDTTMPERADSAALLAVMVDRFQSDSPSARSVDVAGKKIRGDIDLVPLDTRVMDTVAAALRRKEYGRAADALLSGTEGRRALAATERRPEEFRSFVATSVEKAAEARPVANIQAEADRLSADPRVIEVGKALGLDKRAIRDIIEEYLAQRAAQNPRAARSDIVPRRVEPISVEPL